jgi:hypothetical protein
VHDPYTSPRHDYGSYAVAAPSPGGLRRLPFLGALAGLNALHIAMAISLLPENIGLVLVLGFFFAAAAVYLAYHRMKNAALEPWLSLLWFIPIANLYILWCCLASQENYGRTRRLDKPGRVVTGILIGLLSLVIALMVAVAIAYASTH